MVCLNCKKPIERSFNICPYCGRAIKKDKERSTNAQPQNLKKPSPGSRPSNPSRNLIPIDQIYSQLKSAIESRVYWQEKQDELWKYIKTYGVNQEEKMSEIGKNIGKCTYQIHQLINELCKYKVKHSAMKLAYDFLTNEIKRNQKIYSSRVEHTKKVSRGESHWITSSGNTQYSNDKSIFKYNEKKKQAVSKLMKWRNHVSQFL